MIKGKTGFWLLISIFSIITMLAVLRGPEGGGEIKKEMGGTMGQMMKKEHLANWNFQDLFTVDEDHKSMAEQMKSHHSVPWYMKSIDLSGNAAMLMLLPFMVGGSLIMIIVWL